MSKTKSYFVALAIFLLFINYAYADRNRCSALLGEDMALVSTCVTLINMQTKSLTDDELLKLVADAATGGGSVDDLEKLRRDKAKKEAQNQQNLEQERLAEKVRFSQCYSIFSNQREIDTCISLSRLTMGRSGDAEMSENVARRIKMEDADKAEERRKNAAAEKERETRRAALSRSPVGFHLDNWQKDGFGTVMVINFTIQNNGSKLIKNPVLICETYGNSGTRLSQKRQTLFDVVPPKENRTFELNLGFINSQSTRANCTLMK